jgi:hypothetical protein
VEDPGYKKRKEIKITITAVGILYDDDVDIFLKSKNESKAALKDELENILWYQTFDDPIITKDLQIFIEKPDIEIKE